MSEAPRAIRCSYCGQEEPYSPEGLVAMTAHAVRCPADLLASAARHNALLLECLAEVFRWLRSPPGERSAQAMVEKTIEAVMSEVMGG
jgi:hypothetical protein